MGVRCIQNSRQIIHGKTNDMENNNKTVGKMISNMGTFKYYISVFLGLNANTADALEGSWKLYSNKLGKPAN